MAEPTKCKCGKTKDAAGNCDGSHAVKKETPYDKITIRVLGTQNQKVKHVFANVANNKGLMRNMGFVISDPNYDAKMEAIRNKKPFSENGHTHQPVKESFAVPAQEPKPEVKVEQPKNEIPVVTPEVKAKRAYKKRATKSTTETV